MDWNEPAELFAPLPGTSRTSSGGKIDDGPLARLINRVMLFEIELNQFAIFCRNTDRWLSGDQIKDAFFQAGFPHDST